MNETQLLSRIEINPKVLSGKPVIKGTRLSVQYILGLMASGADFDEILEEYTHLEKADVLACFMFAAKSLDKDIFVPLAKEAV